MKVDVAILGSGFGGSLCALIAERIGLRPVLVDRARHPRFTIGESSSPAADLILRDLSDRYDLPRLKPLATWGSWQRIYPKILGGRKRGFAYFRHESGEPFTPDQEHGTELLVAASASDELSDAHWYRMEVDAFFAEEVRRAGIRLVEGIEAAPRRAGGRWRFDALEVEADFVIDASGAGGALARAGIPGAGSSEWSSCTCSRAVYSHFTGLPRWREIAAELGARVDDYPFDPDASALHHVFDGGWMWMLRFENEVVSAGLVLDESRHRPDPNAPPEQEWDRYLAAYPSLARLFAETRLAPAPGRIIRTPRLQRRAARAAGPSWAMLPHTAGFVDPLHSTGIAHTMSGVERLMGILESTWGRPAMAEALESYQAAVFRELDLIDRLVAACYRSTHSFRLWTASTMLYFAAATSYEHARAVGEAPSFLLASEDGLRALAEEALQRLKDPTGYEAWLTEALRPYNRVGLFRPRVPNMYEKTTAPK